MSLARGFQLFWYDLVQPISKISVDGVLNGLPVPEGYVSYHKSQLNQRSVVQDWTKNGRPLKIRRVSSGRTRLVEAYIRIYLPP